MKLKLTTLTLLMIGGATAFLYSCGNAVENNKTNEPAIDSVDVQRQKTAKAIFRGLPEAGDPSTPQAILGKKLYFEKALSINGELNCNSCHMLDKFGVDNLPTSPGHEGKNGNRNSPTVYNASLHFVQFWDGRAENLTEQAKGPILNPVEMGIPDEKTAVKRIKDIEAYTALFAAAFPEEKDPVNYHNIATAIAAYEECLLTPAPFDAYLAGDMNAITPQQKEGLDLFVSKTCISCHMGPALGGSIYQKFGLVNGPYWEYTKSEVQDRGRADITNKENDAFFFKVPSLRNIEKTGPYFHDGSVASLRDAVKIMGQTQLPQELSPEEIDAIVAFLGSLTGEIPACAKQEETALINE